MRRDLAGEHPLVDARPLVAKHPHRPGWPVVAVHINVARAPIRFG
jgi:hypothetical protein